MISFQERVEQTFPLDSHSQFLLDDVGFVKFHRTGPTKEENWGIISTEKADVLFYSAALRKFHYGNSARLKLIPADPQQLKPGTPVTFRVKAREDGRLRAPLVAVWDVNEFNSLQAPEEYRFLEMRPTSGGIGQVEKTLSPREVWRGTCLDHLRSRWPVDRFPVNAKRHFEKLSGDAWTPSTDPR